MATMDQLIERYMALIADLTPEQKRGLLQPYVTTKSPQEGKCDAKRTEATSGSTEGRARRTR